MIRRRWLRLAALTATAAALSVVALPASTGFEQVLGTAVASASVITPAQAQAASSSWQTRLTATFARLQPRLHARAVGVRILVVGRADAVTLGTWRSGPAWSTVKVPLSLAALHHANTAANRRLVRRSITVSDNAAADALWKGLGGGRRAASAVDAVLAAHGDRHTRTQAKQVRPPFSPFGQTAWSLMDQVTFAAGLACDTKASVVKNDMGAVTASQRWGLGRLAHATFKGGWGPDARGRYLVRQFGLIPRGGQVVAVAIAVEPQNGSFDQGVKALDAVSAWLRTSLPTLPAAAHTC